MKKAFLLLSMALLTQLSYGAQSVFDPNQIKWTLSNNYIQAGFQLTSTGQFLALSLANPQTGETWNTSQAQPSSPIHFQAGNDVFDSQRQYSLLDQFTQTTTPSGIRQFIVLQDLAGAAQVTLILELYDQQPVLRYSLRYRNQTGSPVYLTYIDLLPWSFGDSGLRYSAFTVNQWSVAPAPADFETTQTVLSLDGTPVKVYSGAATEQCGWLALRDSNSRGIFAGWEFDGKTKATVAQQGAAGYVQLTASMLQLNHPVQPYDEFQTPYAFLGLFHGDNDEAGYRTQNFMEAVLAKPAPDPGMFPYVAWDSYGYGTQINEQILEQNADAASALGVELFIVDMGWAQAIGNWYEDPVKFPHGLAAVSDYVHSRGMKFGLHFALAEADPNSPVLQAHPDWASTESGDYFGTNSLCLSNQPTQDWLIQQGIRMIDAYNVDWILQDGQNMVKECSKTTHTHDPSDSNYANSVNGINAVVSAIQTARPNVSWENCENGGNMMTFNMVKSYVTSITNDASGSTPARQAAYGATYPFSTRYAERYMPQTDPLNSYSTHSYLFGGNWVMMTQLAGLTPDQTGFMQQEIANYKLQRAKLSGAKVFHILAPSPAGMDAIQSYNAALDNAIAVVSRTAAASPSYTFRPQGLNPIGTYVVSFETSPSVFLETGSQIMTYGVPVILPIPFSSEVVHIDRRQ